MAVGKAGATPRTRAAASDAPPAPAGRGNLHGNANNFATPGVSPKKGVRCRGPADGTGFAVCCRMARFSSYEHLLRLAALFAVGIALFAAVRWLLVPADYGLIGPYRASALAQNRAHPVAYAGQLACIECHADVADVRAANAHAKVSCESCHGALATHATDPGVPPVRLDPRATCAICHLPDSARPAAFKTVDFAEHAGNESCATCHQPHAPRP